MKLTHHISHKKLENGELKTHKLVVQRPNQSSTKWFGKIKIDGKAYRIDLDTNDLEFAKAVITSKFDDLYAHSKANTLTPELLQGVVEKTSTKRTIDSIARLVIADIEKNLTESNKNYLANLKIRILPEFGHEDIKVIQDDIYIHTIYRRFQDFLQKKSNKVKFKSTLNLLQRKAEKLGFMKEIVLPEPKFDTSSVSRFPPFKQSDLNQIISYIPIFASEKKADGRKRNQDHLLMRELMIPALLFVNETGVRGVGEEIAGLKWKHLSFDENSDYRFSDEKYKELKKTRKRDKLDLETLSDRLSEKTKDNIQFIKTLKNHLNLPLIPESIKDEKGNRRNVFLQDEYRRASLHIEKGKTSSYKKRDIELSWMALELIKIVAAIKYKHSLITYKADPNDHIFFGNTNKYTGILKDGLILPLVEENKLSHEYTSYSARTTFIQRKLKAGHTVFGIANYCGTSVSVIQNHYANEIEDIRTGREIADK